MILFESVYKPRAGGATTAAVTRTLAGTRLSQTDVFLRESIQNSYDAKLPNKKPLDLRLSCYKLNEENCSFIKNLFEQAGINGKSFSNKILSTYYNIEVSDRNTTGLTGYCGFQENRSNEEEKLHHFIYMTGNDEIKDKESGGSFGFGKAALYKYSEIRTIVVYSRVKNKTIDGFNSRFIICRLDERISGNNGRCWWGAEGKYEDNTTYAKPLINEEADFMAEKFGMRPFFDNETGTDILILNAVKDNRHSDFKDTFEKEFPILLTHWFWAKMVSPNTEKKIEFSLYLDNDDFSYEILDPNKTYPYSVFSKAYRKSCDYYAHKAGSEITFPVKLERPIVDIGGIFLNKTAPQDFIYDEYIKNDWNKPTVALMRDVEFIVEYRSIEIDTSELDDSRCFGIFHTNRIGHSSNSNDEHEIEHYFRDIENQTHDKWTHINTLPHDFLKKVNSAIPEAIKKFLDIKTSIGNTASISGLVAQKFGAKLGFGFSGGASDSIEDLFDSPNESSIKKSSFSKRKQSAEFSVENGKKIIKVFYDAKIVKDKKLKLFMTPFIKTLDSTEDATEDELKITRLTLIPNGREKTIMHWIPIPKDPKYSFLIEKSGIYALSIEANIQCAFDIKIKKEEING